MPSLFDVESDYAIKNKEKFAKIAPAMGNKFANLDPEMKALVPDAGNAFGEMAYLGNLLTQNPAAFEEIRNKIKVYNAMKSIGIHAAMPKEYGAFNRLNSIISGQGDSGYTPWENPEMLKNKPIAMPMPDFKNPNSQRHIWNDKFMPRTLMEI